MNNNYKLEDFKELLESTDITNVILGLTMLKASIPFKSMTYGELCEFEKQFRAFRYYYKGSYPLNHIKFVLEGKILLKINNCFQRLEKNERQRRNKDVKEV